MPQSMCEKLKSAWEVEINRASQAILDQWSPAVPTEHTVALSSVVKTQVTLAAEKARDLWLTQIVHDLRVPLSALKMIQSEWGVLASDVQELGQAAIERNERVVEELLQVIRK